MALPASSGEQRTAIPSLLGEVSAYHGKGLGSVGDVIPMAVGLPTVRGVSPSKKLGGFVGWGDGEWPVLGCWSQVWNLKTAQAAGTRVSQDLADSSNWGTTSWPLSFCSQKVTYVLKPSGPQSPQPDPAGSPVPQLCVLWSISLPSTQILVALPGSEPGWSHVRCFGHTLHLNGLVAAVGGAEEPELPQKRSNLSLFSAGHPFLWEDHGCAHMWSAP